MSSSSHWAHLRWIDSDTPSLELGRLHTHHPISDLIRLALNMGKGWGRSARPSIERGVGSLLSCPLAWWLAASGEQEDKVRGGPC